MAAALEGGTLDRRSARRQLALLIVAFIPLFLGPGALQLLLNGLQKHAGHAVLSSTVLLAIAYAAMGVHRLLVGWTVRWVGDYVALVAGSLGYALFAAGQWPGLDGWWLALVAAAFGWGGAWVWLVSGATALDLSGRAAFGRATGWMYAASNLGQGLGILALGFLVAGGHTRPAVALAVAFGLAATVLFALASKPLSPSGRGQGEGRADTPSPYPLPRRERGSPARRDPMHLADLLALARDRRVLIVGLFLMANSLSLGVVFDAFPRHLGSQDPARVWMVLPWFFFARAVFSVIGGTLVDRLGRAQSLAGGFALGAVALAVVPFLSATTGLAVASLMMGVQVSLVPVAGTAMVGDMTSSGRRPAALGALFFWRDLGMVIGILGGTGLKDALGPAGFGFLVFAAVLAVFAVLSLFLARHTVAAREGAA